MVGDAARFEDGRRLETRILGVDADQQLDQRRHGHQQEYSGKGHVVADVQIGTSCPIKFHLENHKTTSLSRLSHKVWTQRGTHLAEAGSIHALAMARTVGHAQTCLRQCGLVPTHELSEPSVLHCQNAELVRVGCHSSGQDRGCR